MSKKCIVCSAVGERIKERNIIPRSLLKSAPSKDLMDEDVVDICDNCNNQFSCKSDNVIRIMCQKNNFEYLSETKIAQKISKLRYASDILIKKHDFICDETIRSCEILIKEHLKRSFSKDDLKRLSKLKNDGDNSYFYPGAFLRRKIGAKPLFNIIRSNFQTFIKSYHPNLSGNKSNRVRKGEFDIPMVFEKIRHWQNELGSDLKKKWIDFDGDPVDISSYRYDMFYAKGVKCVECGVEGKYFIKEKAGIRPFHLNLYGKDEDGNEVLMTVDHIYPKSKGGKD
jgi:hypothetical protein